MKRQVILTTIISILIISLIVWAISCAVNPVTKKREFMLLSENDEIALGKQTDQQVLQVYGNYKDTELLNYVNSMGQKMAKLSHRPHLNFEFKVLDSPVINAFAVPGGYVYFTRGILAYLNNEAELAGVMGHEIGHITARHSAKQYSNAQLTQLGLSIGAMASEVFRKYAGLAQFGVQMLFLSFSRDNERQADALGVEYSTKAGYDSNHMANFFVTLERQHPSDSQSGLPEWFSTHPNPPDRIAAIKRDAQKWQSQVQQKQFVVNRDNFLRKIDSITFGDDPQQGYVENNFFYHPQLRFQFPIPADWKVNNTPSQVQMISKADDAVIIFSLANEKSPSEAANAFITSSKATVGKSEATTVNGLRAHRVLSTMATEQGNIGIASYFIQKDSFVFVFHGFSGQAKFEEYLPAFTNTMKQFKNLTDPRKINVKPDRIAIKQIRTQSTLRKAFQQFGVPNDKMENLAIMNGMQLDETVPANTLIKVVVK